VNCDDEYTGYYFIKSMKGINCTVCSQFAVNIDMNEVNQLDYLKIVNKSKEKYLVIIPFNQVTGYFITGFELMRPVAPTLYKQLTLKVSLKRDFEDIELLELLPNTTQLSFEFAVLAGSKNDLRAVY